VTDSAPLPLIGDWAYITAESYRNLGEIQDAITWYRKIVSEFPYSDNYANSWYRLTTEHGKALFKE